MRTIDAKGLACPAPVLQTKAAVEQEGLTELFVLVDNEAAQQNVSRFFESAGFSVELERQSDDFVIKATLHSSCDVAGQAGAETCPATHPATGTKAEKKKIMVMCATDRIGYGDDDLGRKLMISFLKTLGEMQDDLWRLVLVNNGVKLTIDGSDVLDVLKEYESGGLHILVCGTCLTHFDLLDKKAVGETTNMLDIVTAMQLADKVINI